MSLSILFGFLVLVFQGLDSHADQLRILDGQTTKIEGFPYMVSIQNYDGTNHHCGGTIIDRYYVLTAAHCVDGFEPEDFRIVSGTTDWTKPGSIHYVSELVRHENFDLDDSWNNDIALIKVVKPFTFGLSTKPARLPASNAEIKLNTVGIAIGFGRTSKNSGPSEKLLKTELSIRDLSYCNQQYKKHLFKNTQICTQGKNNAAIYKGDSGGPFIVDGTAVGITFTGMAKYPSIFTKISKYIDWIYRNKK